MWRYPLVVIFAFVIVCFGSAVIVLTGVSTLAMLSSWPPAERALRVIFALAAQAAAP